VAESVTLALALPWEQYYMYIWLESSDLKKIVSFQKYFSFDKSRAHFLAIIDNRVDFEA